MRIAVRKKGPVSILDISGQLTTGETEKVLREKIMELLDAGESLIVCNLVEVPYLDSACLGELIVCRQRVRQQEGIFKLVVVGKPYDLFVTSELDRLFEIFRDEEEALASFLASDATAGIP